jgi:MSHA pilin protein MshD
MSIKPAISRPNQCGVTLIELVIFIVIISVGLVGILSVMNITTRNSADPMVRKQAMAIAEAVLEEVLSKDGNPANTLPETDFSNCSNRVSYVGVWDYACFDGVPATAVISGVNTLGSSAIPALAGFAATVAVASVTVSGVALQRVEVTVNGGNQTITLFGYRASGF